MARPQPTSRNRLRVQNSINDNCCVKCVTGQKDFVYVSGKADSLNPSPVVAKVVAKEGLVCNQQERDSKFTCKFLSVLFIRSKGIHKRKV